MLIARERFSLWKTRFMQTTLDKPSDKIYRYQGKTLGIHVHAIGRPTNHDSVEFHLLLIWTSPPSHLMMSCSLIGPNLMPCMTLMMADNRFIKTEREKS